MNACSRATASASRVSPSPPSPRRRRTPPPPRWPRSRSSASRCHPSSTSRLPSRPARRSFTSRGPATPRCRSFTATATSATGRASWWVTSSAVSSRPTASSRIASPRAACTRDIRSPAPRSPSGTARAWSPCGRTPSFPSRSRRLWPRYCRCRRPRCGSSCQGSAAASAASCGSGWNTSPRCSR